jgi:hypothetical protein
MKRRSVVAAGLAAVAAAAALAAVAGAAPSAATATGAAVPVVTVKETDFGMRSAAPPFPAAR